MSKVKWSLDDLIKYAKDIDFGDIKSPNIKKGRPKISPRIEPNPIELGSTKNNLELGGMPSSDVSLNEFDLGKADPLALKPGRNPKSPFIEPNPIELGSTKNNLELGDTQSSPIALNERVMPDITTPSQLSLADDVVESIPPKASALPVDVDAAGIPKKTSAIPTEIDAAPVPKLADLTDDAGNVISKETAEKTLAAVDKMPEGPLKEIAKKKTSKLRRTMEVLTIGGLVGAAAMSGKKTPDTVPPVSKLNSAIAKSDDLFSSKSPNYNTVAQGEVPGSFSAEEQSSNQPSTKSLESQQQNKPISKVNQLLEEAGGTENSAQAKDDRLNYMMMMQNAQNSANQNQLGAALLKAGMQAGAAIAGPGVKADYSLADSLAASADKSVSNVKELMATDISSKKLQQIQNEMDDEAKNSDPNSAISKITAAVGKKYGLDIKTAKEAKLLPPQLYNLLSQEIAHSHSESMANKAQANARSLADKAQTNAMSIAKLENETRAAKEQTSLNEKQRKFGASLRKEATSGELGKLYTNFVTGQKSLDYFSNFMKNPSGYKDYGMLSGSLRALQGDNSVIKEAELRLGKAATSIIDKGLNYMDELASGKSLQPGQRKEMLDAVKILTAASKNSYMTGVKPILNQADAEGISHNLILDESLLSSSNSSESQGLTTPNTRTFKVKQVPGSKVTVKSGETYKIGADGLTGVEIPK